ncbi:MAG: hypothetical protein KAY22_05580 [Rhizorhabdus sp.]|uniref:hypothetical protein n=1 Tax=Rhizorhabdus sp. TaxID=1968843 RepID=UPI001B5ECB39|nr:hypothetical protein [Rhizorhabdus sp.]MBP8231756.1 hypothetical protein [Rhizorhabdus sp.]
MSAPNPFLLAYIGCALWASTDDSGEPLDAAYDAADLAPKTLERMREACEGFRNANAALLADWPLTQAGHDFWLTRNRHGAGFWDRDWPNGDALTAAAHAYGEQDLYVGDDGRLYLS